MSDFKETIDNWILDRAEALSRCNYGTISTLKGIREDQRRRAKECHAESRAPENTFFHYEGFCIIEVFTIDQTGEIIDRIKRNFPDGKNTAKLINEINQQKGAIQGGLWSRLGRVSRDHRMLGIIDRQDLSLPDFINHIEICLHQVLPSIYSLSYHFHLNDHVNKAIAKNQNQYYLPRIRFKRLIPKGLLAGGYTQFPAENSMQKAIQDCIQEFRDQCINWIDSQVKGSPPTLRQHKTTRILRPLDIVRLSGDFPDSSKESKWVSENRKWLNSLGFDFDYLRDFQSDSFRYCFPARNNFVKKLPPKLLIKESSPQHQLEFILQGLITFETLVGILNGFQQSAKHIRSVLPHVNAQVKNKLSGKDTANALSTHLETQFFKRIQIENRQHKGILLHSMEMLSSLMPFETKDNKLVMLT